MASLQSLVAWSDEFNLGMAEIDAQHKVLLDLINQVWRAIVSNAERTQTLRIVEELEKYTLTHFTAEEIFMREIDYRDFPAHKDEHEKFVARVAEEKAKIAAGQSVSLDLVHFLKDWLINHILVSDKQYAEEYKKRQEPQSTLGRFFKRLLG
jgi:hemerythrin-like metal-binding protein